MELLNVDTVDQVFIKLEEHFKHITWPAENVRIRNVVGRYLARPLFSDTDMPQFRRSVVDGYAVKASDTFGVSDSMPVFLDVTGAVDMGAAYEGAVEAGKAVYVPTGGMVPEGADAIVMVEYAEKLNEATIAVYKPAAPGNGIMNMGDDFKKDTEIYKTGKRIFTKDIGMLAATGNSIISVFKKPVVSVISTGDEIIDITQAPAIGQIRDINTYALAAMCEELGLIVNETHIVKDDFENFRKAVEEQIATSDIVLVSGSSSAGIKDMTAAVLDHIEKGSVFTHGIAIKPGKPTVIASVCGKPVFGLPGHPVSAIVVFSIIVERFIKSRYFRTDVGGRGTLGKMTTNVHGGVGRETYQFVRLKREAGEYAAVPIFAKSGAISQLMQADGYVRIPSLKEGLKEGEVVEIVLF